MFFTCHDCSSELDHIKDVMRVESSSKLKELQSPFFKLLRPVSVLLMIMLYKSVMQSFCSYIAACIVSSEHREQAEGRPS